MRPVLSSDATSPGTVEIRAFALGSIVPRGEIVRSDKELSDHSTSICQP